MRAKNALVAVSLILSLVFVVPACSPGGQAGEQAGAEDVDTPQPVSKATNNTSIADDDSEASIGEMI